MGEFEEKLRQEFAAGRVVIVVGAGVSLGATNRNELAGWLGLLRNGIERCVELLGDKLPADWRDRQLANSRSSDLDDVLGVAQQVERKLRGHRKGEYATWLRDTVGALEADDSDVLDTLRESGCALATTNYDSLLENATNLPTITWRSSEGAKAVRFLRGEEKAILHLHGYWDEPDSVVLGLRSYEEILNSDVAQHVQRTLATDKTLVFVGCGAGLEDPNFELLRLWMEEVLGPAQHRHYRLALESEAGKLRELHGGDGIHVLPYGKEHADLAPFLKGLSRSEQGVPTPTTERRPSRLQPTDATAARDKARAVPAFDIDRYLKHVESTCGWVNLTGLLSEKTTPTVPVEDVYVSLLATRPNIRAPERHHKPGSAAEALFSADDLIGGTGAFRERKQFDQKAIRAVLEELGVTQQPENLDALADSVARRIKNIEGPLSWDQFHAAVVTMEIDEAFTAAKSLLIEGDPGSGKTTILMHVAMALACAHRGDIETASVMGFTAPYPLPVFVALRRFHAWLQDMPARGLQKSAALLIDFLRETEGAYGGNHEWLATALERGELVLLLDGADEIPNDEQRERIAHVVSDFVQQFKLCRYALTSRPVGLRGTVAATLEKSGGLARCVVQPLDVERTERFVRAWYKALVKNSADAVRRADDLVARIRASSNVAKLAETPIMLTAIAVVHHAVGSLPERRADLYERCVKALCGLWDEARDELGKQLCGPINIDGKIRLLQEVAFRVHQQGADARSIERGELLAVAKDEFKEQLGRVPGPRECEDLVRSMCERSGLVIPDGQRDYRFRHLTFQEYLVARRICDRSEDAVGDLAPHIVDGWWREVFSLVPAYKAIYSSSDALRLARQLARRAVEVSEPAERVAALATIARSIVDLREYKVAGLDVVVESLATTIAELVDDASQPGMTVDRVVIAELLGYFDKDPRLRSERCWVAIPESQNEKSKATRKTKANPKATKEVTVAAFEIHRWPVTVGEYARIIGADARPFVTIVKSWQYLDERTREVVVEHVRKTAKVASPENWEYQLHQPLNRPVVGVNWFEAMVYCAWLQEKAGAGVTICLPSESQWERAARNGQAAPSSDEHDYPWHGAFDPARANTGEMGLGSTSAVGSFPAGHTPAGVWDMAGNVWEWCANDVNENATPNKWRGYFPVVRGGCFGINADLARCSIRRDFPTDFRVDFIGFRPARFRR